MALLSAGLASAALGQNEFEAQQGEPPERIDLTVSAADRQGPLEDCSAEQEAAAISGEIVVCRRQADQSDLRYSGDDAAERRYAEATMNKGDPKAPDVFGIPRHGMTVARGCFIGPCPPPKALIIDVEALPEAPPGSDADRIGRGLSPIGNEGEATEEGPSDSGKTPADPPNKLNPSESASPMAGPSG